jgi:8-oxo-dGTP diphosphatase
MKVGQKAIIMKDNKYLLLHKSLTVPRFPGYWDFPGGGLEENEDPFEGIKREILEETNLKANPLKVTWKTQMKVNDIMTEYRIYSVELLSDEIKLSHEHTEYKWVTKDELLKMKIQPYIKLYSEEN